MRWWSNCFGTNRISSFMFWMFQRKEEGAGREAGREGGREGEMFGTSRTFSLCSECSKARAVKEMFWMFQREHWKMFQMFRKQAYKLLKEYLGCWTLHVYFYKKRYITIILCVCVCERERERHTHTHTHTREGILLRKTKKGSSMERERERENQGVHHMWSKSCNLEPKWFAEETPKDDLDGVLLLWLYRL